MAATKTEETTGRVSRGLRSGEGEVPMRPALSRASLRSVACHVSLVTGGEKGAWEGHLYVSASPCPPPSWAVAGGVGGGPRRRTPLGVPGALLTPFAPDPAVAAVGLDPHSRLVPGGGLQRWQRHAVGVLEGLRLALLWAQVCEPACRGRGSARGVAANPSHLGTPALCSPAAPC